LTSINGDSIVSLDEQGMLLRWRIDWEGQRAQTMVFPQAKATAVTLSSDGQTVATAQAGHVELWDARYGVFRGRLPAGAEPIVDLAFAPLPKDDTVRLVSCSADGELRNWTGAELAEQPVLYVGGVVQAATFVPGGGRLCACAHERGLVLLDVLRQRTRLRLFTESPVTSLDAVPISGGSLLAVGLWNGQCVVWQLEQGRIQRLASQQVAGSASVRAVSLSPIAPLLAAVTGRGALHVLGLEGELGESLSVDGRWLRCAHFSPDGSWLAAGADNGQIHRWQHQGSSWAERPPIDAHQAEVLDVRWLAAGQLVSIGGDDQLKLWDVATGQPLAQATHSNLRGLAVSPPWLTTAGIDAIRVWRFADGQLQPHGPSLPQPARLITAIALSPNGQQLLAASQDRALRLWDLSGPRAGHDP
jgi:WD40 repeat protein